MNEEPVFRTITEDDWRRSIKLSRERPNLVVEQIRKKIKELNDNQILRKEGPAQETPDRSL